MVRGWERVRGSVVMVRVRVGSWIIYYYRWKPTQYRNPCIPVYIEGRDLVIKIPNASIQLYILRTSQTKKKSKTLDDPMMSVNSESSWHSTCQYERKDLEWHQRHVGCAIWLCKSLLKLGTSFNRGTAPHEKLGAQSICYPQQIYSLFGIASVDMLCVPQHSLNVPCL